MKSFTSEEFKEHIENIMKERDTFFGKIQIAYGYVYRFFRDIPYNIRNTYRRVKLGFWPVEAWNLDTYVAKYTLPRLRHLRQNLNGHPMGMEHSEWEQILDSMIYSMEYVSGEKESWPLYSSIDHYQKLQHGLDIFGKYFQNLWD